MLTMSATLRAMLAARRPFLIVEAESPSAARRWRDVADGFWARGPGGGALAQATQMPVIGDRGAGAVGLAGVMVRAGCLRAGALRMLELREADRAVCLLPWIVGGSADCAAAYEALGASYAALGADAVVWDGPVDDRLRRLVDCALPVVVRSADRSVDVPGVAAIIWRPPTATALTLPATPVNIKKHVFQTWARQ